MVVNLARPVTYDKAQQLAVHELTHHMQFVLMDRHLYHFPEMRVALDDGPMGMLLEGGAEVAVDLFFPPGNLARQEDLAKRLPGPLKSCAAHMLAVERLTWSGLWSASIRIAKQLMDGEISPQHARHAMLTVALKPDSSWPTQTQHATLLDAYIAVAKRPPTPGRMGAVIGAAGLASSQAGFGEKIGDEGY